MAPPRIHGGLTRWSTRSIPRSFQDSNGDGIGDLKGITSRLDYLADLGVDVLWLSPVFKSPQDDNGYDISDYQDIDPLFGTMADMDELLAEAHKRGLKVIMDLVVNHTSDEHAWFQASRDKNDPHADWYWWRPAKPGHEPGTPGCRAEPVGLLLRRLRMGVRPEARRILLPPVFQEAARPQLGESRGAQGRLQDDELVDGSRHRRLPHGRDHPDLQDRRQERQAAGRGRFRNRRYCRLARKVIPARIPFCSDGPRIDEFLAEMRREVFEGREGYINVGEAPGITPARNEHVTDPANKELDMLFLFDHVGIDQEGSKWNTVPFEVKNLRDRMTEQQEAVRKAGWASLFFCNHDQPRVVSRWGNDSDRDSRELSAKAFGMVLHMHRGTPYIYEGEELGMTNAHFTKLEQYRDLEALNGYRQRVEEAKCQSSESMMAALALIGRDNARTPMQWDASKYAGFTPADAAAEPWISVNPNHVEINAAEEFDDPDSVYTFYKKLIAMRHNSATISTGEWHLLAADSDQVYAFTRTNGDDTILVVVNLTDRSADAACGRGGAAFRRRVRAASTAQHL